MFHQQKKHLCCRDHKLVISDGASVSSDTQGFEIDEGSVACALCFRTLNVFCFFFSERLILGAFSSTCTCGPICAAISLQYICVSTRLRREHEKWRRARSSVPRIGAVHSSVNRLCVCACVCEGVSQVFISICFHHFWKAGMTSLPTASPSCTVLPLRSSPYLMSRALSPHLQVPVAPPLLFGD